MNAAREASAIRVTPQGDEWHGDGRVHSAVPVPFITRSSDQSAQSGFLPSLVRFHWSLELYPCGDDALSSRTELRASIHQCSRSMTVRSGTRGSKMSRMEYWKYCSMYSTPCFATRCEQRIAASVVSVRVFLPSGEQTLCSAMAAVC